jgi:tetrahydromethanopterin S-methyltransferase subunit F
MAIVGRSMPYDVGMVAAGVIGIAAGLVVSRLGDPEARHAKVAER